jgi:VanZ family protein
VTTVLRALAAVAWMALIFVLSAQPDVGPGLGAPWDEIVTKLAHFTEYLVLTLLWAWALRPVTSRAWLAAAIIAVVYALSDEYHQSFVEGRTASVSDFAVDALGIAVALAALRYHRRVRSGVRAGFGET